MVREYHERIRIAIECSNYALPATAAQIGQIQLVGADLQLGNVRQPEMVQISNVTPEVATERRLKYARR